MNILGIETSCDETSAAVIKDGDVASSIISSQEVHARFGGVVPELASRAHVRLIVPIVEKTLKEADCDITDMDGFAVTHGPGLVGALLVGLNFVKGAARALGKPFIGVNHIEGHIYGNLLTQEHYTFPMLFLIVSGGHTQLVVMSDHLKYRIVGQTRDDAVGEAFDKGAKMLGLGYPGGPEMDRRAQNGDAAFFRFPRAKLKNAPFDFSYSGLKTALLTYIQSHSRDSVNEHLDDICASYQEAAVDVLVTKTLEAAQHFDCKTVAIAGGVAANSLLRRWLANDCQKKGLELLLPELRFCTDNAAMIARAGWEYLKKGVMSPPELNAYPALKLNET